MSQSVSQSVSARMPEPPRGPFRGDGPAPAPGEISLLRVVNVVLKHRALVLGLALLVVCVVAAVTLLAPRTYSSSTLFMPQARKMPSNLSGIAAQFGVALPGSDPGESPQFYVDLIQSREILRPVVDSSYRAAGVAGGAGPRTAAFADLYRVTESDPARRREAAIRRLREAIRTTVSAKTGIVTLTVRAPDPELARGVTHHVLTLLEAFNREKRKSQAQAEREFTERRLAEVRGELRTAENRLEGFLQTNRAYRGAPSLEFEQERLARDLSFRQQVFATLSQSYEQAKIDEVRDTPVLTVIEAPEAPVNPDSRYVVIKCALALALGLLLGVLVAVVREYIGGSNQDPTGELQTFAALRRQALTDIRHPLRAVGRAFGRGRSPAAG